MVAVPGSLTSAGNAAGPGCERVLDGPLDEPVAALTSLAFVVAALVVVLGARRRADRAWAGDARVGQARAGDAWAGQARGRDAPAASAGTRDHRWGVADPRVLGYAGWVAAVGVGSFIQHGPDPAWSDPAHDLPLLATVALLGSDAAADLTSRARAWWWWVPVVVLAPLVVLLPRVGDLAQVAVAALAVALTVLRAVARPALRARIGAASAVLVVGATVGTLSRAGGPLCDPTSPWQGHGVWHVLAAAALAVLAPTVGHRGTGGTGGTVARR